MKKSIRITHYVKYIILYAPDTPNIPITVGKNFEEVQVNK
jgi:hypothetical protein